MASGNYEFTESQNQIIGNLAYNMRGVGTTALMLGLLYFFFGAFLMLKGDPKFAIVALNPAALVEPKADEPKADEPKADVEAKAADAAVEADNSNKFVIMGRRFTPARIQGAFVFLGGVLFLLLGAWTMGAAAPFEKIVSTRGNDIRHLMDAMDNLRKLFASLYSMILLFVFAGLSILILSVVMLNR